MRDRYYSSLVSECLRACLTWSLRVSSCWSFIKSCWVRQWFWIMTCSKHFWKNTKSFFYRLFFTSVTYSSVVLRAVLWLVLRSDSDRWDRASAFSPYLWLFGCEWGRGSLSLLRRGKRILLVQGLAWIGSSRVRCMLILIVKVNYKRSNQRVKASKFILFLSITRLQHPTESSNEFMQQLHTFYSYSSLSDWLPDFCLEGEAFSHFPEW